MKKTVTISPQNEPVVSALMNAINFKEVDRVATGGMQSSEMLIMTFEGNEADYDESGYAVKNKVESYSKRYFSLRFPNGHPANTIQEFWEAHRNIDESFTLHRFNN